MEAHGCELSSSTFDLTVSNAQRGRVSHIMNFILLNIHWIWESVGIRVKTEIATATQPVRVNWKPANRNRLSNWLAEEKTTSHPLNGRLMVVWGQG